MANAHVKNPADVDGTTGYVYFQCFNRRNSHRIVSKQGEKFDIDRHNWCACRNFKTMCYNIAAKMVDAKLAVESETPVFMDYDRNVCEKDDSFGRPITHDIMHSQ